MWCSLLLSRLRAGTHYTRLRRSALTQALFFGQPKKRIQNTSRSRRCLHFPTRLRFSSGYSAASRSCSVRCWQSNNVSVHGSSHIFHPSLSLWLNIESTSLDSLVAIVNNSGREQEAPPRQNLINYWIFFLSSRFRFDSLSVSRHMREERVKNWSQPRLDASETSGIRLIFIISSASAARYDV